MGPNPKDPMKQTAIAGAAALALIAAPAQAATILPMLYASTYCELRDMGLSDDDARSAAMRQAMVPGDNWVTVTYNGKQTTSDVILSVRAVIERCPHHLPK